MKVQEIREKGVEERHKLLLELRKKVRELRFAIAGREVRNHRELRAAKKSIARLLTIGREEEVTK